MRPETVHNPSVNASADLVFFCAASLACEGEHDSAERLLAVLPPEEMTAPMLDLLARVYAQQGKYADAEVQWKRALQLAPDNAEYRLCRQTAEDRCLRTDALPWLWRLAGVLTIGLVLTLLVSHYFDLGHRRVMPGTDKVTGEGPSSSWQAQSRSQLHVVASFKIHLHHPLFANGTTFSNSGKHELQQFAGRLRALDSAARVEIEGCTDSRPVKPGERFRDNDELALARANRVAILLHRESGFSLRRISLGSAAAPRGEGHPSVTDLSRHTVLIRVVTGEK